MDNKIFLVDAFTDSPFAGNPAAVCFLSGPAEDTWMQNISREMNVSETAFLYPAVGGFQLRWFSPELEVDLCGHATLASAHILWEESILNRKSTGRFFTKSGLLTAELRDHWIFLNFPIDETCEQVSKSETGIIEEALKVKPLYLVKTRYDFLVEVETEEILRGLNPKMELLKRLPGRGTVVTSRATAKSYDFVSRFFGPKCGINEDPVTGSSHCALTPYWGGKLKKKEMMAYQASLRGGMLRVKTEGDRVILGGQAVTVFRGELCGP
jgi:PhzF family phenazine biosynthesis protein